MRILTRKVVADLTRRRGRTTLMVLGIFVGVLGLTAIAEATQTLGGAFAYATDADAVPNISFTVDRLPTPVAQAIARLPNVARFQLRTTYGTFWLTGGGQQNLEIEGYQDFTRTELGTFDLVAGRLPGPGELVLDDSDQAVAPVALGETVSVAAPDGRPVTLRVVGRSRTRGIALWHTPAAVAIGYMRADALQHLTTLAPGANAINPLPQGTQILIRTRDLTIPGRQTYDTIARMLSNAGVQIAPGVSQFHDVSYDADTRLGVEGVLAVMRLLAGLALLLVAVLLVNIVSTLVAEQFKIIGTMKALGGTRWRITWSYLVTIVLYSLPGTVLGLALGLTAGYELAVRLAGTVRLPVGETGIPLDAGPFEVLPLVLVGSVLLGLLVPPLTALWPLWRGAGITVREAVAAYGIRAGTGGLRRQRIRAVRVSWIPQSLWLGLRGLFRRRDRVGVTLLSLTLSVAVFFAVQLTDNSLRAGIEQIDQSFHSNLRVDLTDAGAPVPAQSALAALRALPNVTSAEAIDPLPIAIAQRELELYGLSAETRLYQPKLVAGRWLTPQDAMAIVINDVAAVQLHLDVGERIALQIDAVAAEPVTFLIVGVVHDLNDVSASGNPQGRLGAAFTTLDTLDQLRQTAPGTAERLWIRARDHSPAALQHLQRQVEATLRTLGLSGAYVLALQQDFAQWSGAQQINYALFDAMAFLVVIVATLGLAHTLAASVVERQVEIGILRALGATGRRVAVVFGIQGLALAVLAWTLGVAPGLGAGAYVVGYLGTFMPPIDVAFHPLLLPAALLFAAGLAVLASAGPALAASKMRIHRALRYA